VAPAGTVNVAAGTFTENVSVAKSISLLGAQNGVDARGRVAAESIINGQVTLTAANTNLDGFKIQNSTTGAGVVASNAQGDHIVNNIITNNVFGLSLASDGPVLVKNNAFDTNTQPGSASGNGIYTDFTVSNVKGEANSFTGDTEGSVSFFGSVANPQSNVQIVDNTMTDDGPISLETINNVTITGNTINNSAAHAIWIAGGVSITINSAWRNNGARA
jgi:parallel beta-helix repeat protein